MVQDEGDVGQVCDVLISGGRVRTADGVVDPIDDGAVDRPTYMAVADGASYDVLASL